MERTQLSAIVLDLLEKETGETYDALDDSTTLNEGLGLDSLDMAGLILHIESHFGIQIETELLDKIKNIGQILDTLEEKIACQGRKTRRLEVLTMADTAYVLNRQSRILFVCMYWHESFTVFIR